MSAILKGVLAVIALLPQILQLVKQLGELVEKGTHYIDVRLTLKKLDAASEKAKEGKDTSELEKLLNPPSTPRD